MKEMTEQEIRENLLRLLILFKKFCKRNHITYYLMFGSLLGAVRHKGFIPWDNDIDLAIPREDYNRMITMLKDDDANPDFRFLCFENDPNFKWQHGRISDKRTYMKTAAGYSRLGLSLDLFPLDNQGNQKKDVVKRANAIKDCIIMRIMCYDFKYKALHLPNGMLPNEQIRLLKMFLNEGKQDESYWVKKAIQLATQNSKMKNCKYYGNFSNDFYPMPNKREWYSNTVSLPFEGIDCPAPVGYDEILKAYYGNYMILPPEHERNKINTTHIFFV